MDGGSKKKNKVVVVDEKYCEEDEERELTVRKTCLFYPGDGFAAYDHHTGDLVFRVDTYARGPALADQLVLMDPSGDSILTVRRKWPSLHQRWEGFLGERMEGQKPLFTVRRSSIFGGERGSISVEVHGGDGPGPGPGPAEYRIEGSFAQRCCRLLVYVGDDDDDQTTAGLGDGDLHEDHTVHDRRQCEEVVAAEIKRKVDACAHVVLGRDVFCLSLKPGFDAAFAMGLVLVLDRISGDDDDDEINGTVVQSNDETRNAHPSSISSSSLA